MHDPTSRELALIFSRVARDPWMPVDAIPKRYLPESDTLPKNLGPAAISAAPVVPTQPKAPDVPEVQVVVTEPGQPDFMADLILPSPRQPAALVTAAATKENSK